VNKPIGNLNVYSVLCCTLLLTILVAGHAAARTSPAAPGVRMRWEDFVKGPDGKKRLDNLQKAIKKMKSLDNSPPDSADFRRSWIYWANIHGYYGQPSPDGTVEAQIQYLQQNGLGKYVSYYKGIVDQTPPDSIAQTVWATCQHSGGTQDEQAQNFFLWHRMYLYYFEKVLQWASGDSTLRLPYWNYTDPTQEAIPAAFLDKNSVLYDEKRDPGMNAGTQTLNPNSTDIDNAMKMNVYLDYEFNIERHIHGYVHCTVGPTCPVAHMGDVPVAGGDPVFYSHHANIDRLFACWETKYGVPSGSWSTQTFGFPDAKGILQTQAVSDFLDTKKLGYVYDNESACTRTAALAGTAEAALTPLATPQVLGSAPALSVDRPQVSVDIPLSEASRAALTAQAVTSAGPVYLVLSDITAQSPPGTLLDVYIAKKGSADKKLYVGTISWFNDFGVGKHHQIGPMKKTLRFDVTDQLKKLDIGSEEALSLSIQASSGRISAKETPTQELRASDAAAFRTEAHVQIGAIQLRQGLANSSK